MAPLNPMAHPPVDPGQLHPLVRKQLRAATAARSILGLTIVGGGLFLAYALYMEFGPQQSHWPLLALAGGVAVFILVDTIVRRLILEPMRRAAWILVHTAGRPMRLYNTGVSDLQGLLMALCEPDEEVPVAIVSVMASKKGAHLRNLNTRVELYTEPYTSRPLLVMLAEDFLLWGRPTTRESRALGARRLRLLMGGLLFSLPLLFGVFFHFQSQLVAELEQDTALALESATWPTVSGVVVASRVEDRRISRGKSSVPGYLAVVEYTYELGGETYRKGNIAFCSGPTEDQAAVLRFLAAYPVGHPVEVAVHPERPALSVLYPGYADSCRKELAEAEESLVWVGLFSAAMFLVLAVVFGFMVRKQQQLLRRVEAWQLP